MKCQSLNWKEWSWQFVRGQKELCLCGPFIHGSLFKRLSALPSSLSTCKFRPCPHRWGFLAKCKAAQRKMPPPKKKPVVYANTWSNSVFTAPEVPRSHSLVLQGVSLQSQTFSVIMFFVITSLRLIVIARVRAGYVAEQLLHVDSLLNSAEQLISVDECFDFNVNLFVIDQQVPQG